MAIQGVLRNPSFKNGHSTCFQKLWPTTIKVFNYVTTFLNNHVFAITIGVFVSWAYYKKAAEKNTSILAKTCTSLAFGLLAGTSSAALYVLSTKIITLTTPYFQRFFPQIIFGLKILLAARLIFVFLFPSERRSFFN